jgi:hypothetical protein
LIDDARLFGTEGYPSINELQELIVRMRDSWEFHRENDIIRTHAADRA